MSNKPSISLVLESLDPRIKLFAILAVSLLAILGESFIYLSALAAFSLILVLISPLRSEGGLRLVLGLSLFLVWGTALGQGFFYQEEPRRALMSILPPFRIGGWEFEGLIVYAEGLLYGVKQSLRLLAIAWAGAALCRSTPAPQIISVLRWLKLPFALSFMVVTALRFMPQLLDEIRQVRLARRLKGFRFWKGNILKNLFSEFKMLRPIFANLIRRSHTKGLALAIRGFHSRADQTTQPMRVLSARDWILFGALGGAVTVMATLRLLYVMYHQGLFYSSSLRPLYAFVREWL